MPRAHTRQRAKWHDRASESTAPPNSMKEVLELLSKAIIGFAAICFVCGIIVVNLYLRDFGVASFSLFRVSYITAGVWTFSPLAFAALILGTVLMSLFSDAITGKDEAPKAKKLSGKLSNWGTAAGIAITVLVALFAGLQIAFNWKWIVAIVLGAVLGILVAGTLFASMQGEKRAAIILGVAGVLAFLFYLLYLAPALYRQIPASLGGGAGMPAVLVIATDKYESVVAAGIPFQDSSTTKPVTLLIATDKTYVVLPPDSKSAVTLSADLVVAIRHLPAKK